jgi:vancomycin resistance protein YoaR
MTRWRRRRVFVDDLPKTHDLRYGVLFLLGLVLSTAALYGIGFLVAGDKVPSGTTIAGVDIGGMTRGEATIAIQEELAARIEKPLTLVAAGHSYSVDPQRSGLAFDIDASINNAMDGPSWDPRHMLQVLVGGHEVEPVVLVDHGELKRTLRRISNDIDRAPRNALVEFSTGGPQVRFGHTGQRLDRRRAQARMVAAVQGGAHRVVLPVRSEQPTVTDTDATTFARTVGTRASQGRVTLRVAGSTVTLRPGRFLPALATRVADSGLRLAVQPRRLYERSQQAIASLPTAPVNATVAWGRHRPVVVPGHEGTTVSARDWSRAVLTALHRPTRRAWCAVSTTRPAFTTRDAQQLAVRSRLASYGVSRSIPYADLAVAARQLGGTLLKPGETVSFLRTVDAQLIQPAASALAGPTYIAAYRAGATVLKHTPDKHYNPVYPEGLSARVAAPNRDLVLRNDSPYGVYLSTSVRRLSGGGGRVSVDVWSSRYWRVKVDTSKRHFVVKPTTRVVRSGHCSPRRGVAGFEVTVTRTLWRSGRQVDSDVTRTSYAPLDRIRCR